MKDLPLYRRSGCPACGYSRWNVRLVKHSFRFGRHLRSRCASCGNVWRRRTLD